MTSADIIVRCLKSVGVGHIFGVPGGALTPLNNALYQSGIQVIVTKHEQGAAFMADGYARVSGKLGVCCGTSGPGATNLITGIASSFADSIPVLALTGQVATSVFGKGAVQEFAGQSQSVVSIFKQVTKYSDIIINERKTSEMVVKALRTALSGRKGPVHLNMPTDVMKRSLPDEEERPHLMQMPGFNREDVKQAAILLLRAKRPVIIAGWGVVLSRADEELLALAETLGIPVASSPKGKGIFNERHPLSLGVLGFAGSPLAKEYLTRGEVDVMLAVGTSFNEWITSGWDKRLRPNEALIQVDVDPDEIGKNYQAHVGLFGDAKVILGELLWELKRTRKRDRTGASARSERLQELNALRAGHRPARNYRRAGGPCKPQCIMADLMQSAPSDSIFFVDNGNSMAWAIRHLTITRPYSFYIGLGFASMGFAVAAAIGGKIAAPHRPVISIVGDGAFLMNGMEVATAVNYGIPVIWVVMNNAMLGMVYHGWKLFNSPEAMSSRFKQVDFVALAESLGARGIRITKPGEITPALLRRIVDSRRPTVLDVIVDPEEVPPIQSRIATLEKLY